MQPADEIVDVVDDANRIVRQAGRGEVFANRLRHRSVAVLCRNGRGEIFVHRRTATKRVFPGQYDAFISGGVRSGEDYATAAAREVAEELGITGVSPRHVFTFRHDGPELPQWIGIFEVRWDAHVHPEPDEIDWSCFLPESVVAERMDQWDFCPDTRDAFRRYRS